jgi:DNA-binding MarR family transcriptional regulator
VANRIPDPNAVHWLDEREQRAWRGFIRMNAVVQDQLRRQMQRDTDLSLADYEVLVSLSEAIDGALRSYQLADLLHWEASRLSHQLRRMEGRDLVARRSCGEDGRGITNTITAAGRKAIEAAAPLHVAEVRRAFIDRLSDAQLAGLAELADAIVPHAAPVRSVIDGDAAICTELVEEATA